MTDDSRTQRSGEETVIYRNGSVYSPADPLATAALVRAGRVLWVGQEAGADSLTDEAVRTVDLDGLLLAPGFVAGALAAAAEEDAALLAAGYTAVVEGMAGEPRLRRLGGDARASSGPESTAGSYAAVREDLLVAASDAPDADRLDGAASILLAVRTGKGTDDAWVDPVHRALVEGRPAGIVTALAPSSSPDAKPTNPWSVTTTALRLDNPAPGISTRGCFGLQTRGVRRIFGDGGPFGGQIVPDAPADFVAWRAESLMVQTADQRIAAWSTDPRARTPLLPALGEDELPRAEFAVVAGRHHDW